VITKLIYALLVAVAVAVVCLILAAILDVLHVSFASDIADILRTYAPAFGILAGIAYFLGWRTSALP
jgi:hypothetical protein